MGSRPRVLLWDQDLAALAGKPRTVHAINRWRSSQVTHFSKAQGSSDCSGCHCSALPWMIFQCWFGPKDFEIEGLKTRFCFTEHWSRKQKENFDDNRGLDQWIGGQPNMFVGFLWIYRSGKAVLWTASNSLIRWGLGLLNVLTLGVSISGIENSQVCPQGVWIGWDFCHSCRKKTSDAE